MRHQNADASHPIELLRIRGKRPNRRSAEHGYEVPPSNAD
jgi:hypothetical protein